MPNKMYCFTLDALPWPESGAIAKYRLEADLVCYLLPLSRFVTDSLFVYEDGTQQEGTEIVLEEGTMLHLLSFSNFGFIRVMLYDIEHDTWYSSNTYKY